MLTLSPLTTATTCPSATHTGMISLTREGNNKQAAKQLQDLFSSMNRQEPKNAELFFRVVSAKHTWGCRT